MIHNSNISVGSRFMDGKSEYKATIVVHERNALFTWSVVTAQYTGVGPMPMFHKDEKRFIMNRVRISDGFKY